LVFVEFDWWQLAHKDTERRELTKMTLKVLRPWLGTNLHVENHQTTNLSVNSLAMGEHQEVDFLAMGEHQEENSQSPKHDENFSG